MSESLAQPGTEVKLILSKSNGKDTAVPKLTKAQQLKELIHNRPLIQFRIDKQYKLIEKIRKGKWKSTNHDPKFLESLAKLDLDLLLTMIEKNDEQQIYLRKQIENGEQ